MNMKLFRRLSAILTASSALFALSSVHLAFDVSFWAFPLCLIFSLFLYFCTEKKLFSGKKSFIPVFREILQYEPYVLLIAFVLRRAGEDGTTFALDAIQVFLWLLASGLSLLILHFLNPKKIKVLSEDWKEAELVRKEKAAENRRGIRKIAFETVSWIDALVQAVFMVLLLNVFLVQLYEIPSESMVPEFLVKDRVVVFKFLNGPKFPLSKIGLPHLKNYKRGDIVVFRNPHYSDDRKSEVKTFVSQLVYMCTLTMKNINVDEHGRPKADPLVKRVAGLPGEQLMMQDGVLYSRTNKSDDWQIVDKDASYACWNLNEAKSSVKPGIQEFNVSQEQIDLMNKCEDLRKNLDIESVRIECESLADEFDLIRQSIKVPETPDAFNLTARERNVYALFSQNEKLARLFLSSPNGAEAFRAFMTSWKKRDFSGDLYSEANFRLNLMIKLTFGRLVVNNARILSEQTPVSEQSSDTKRQKFLEDANMLFSYICLLDRRNMPIFPPNDENGSPQYIPENSYFMMGDNRFNSLDMRHSYDEHLCELDETDEFGATYPSNIAPQYVPREKILGTTAYRFWPVSRRGVPGHTGK